jgi:hypothetical protein
LQSRRGEYNDICSCKTHDRTRIENIVTSTDTDVVALAISMFEKFKIPERTTFHLIPVPRFFRVSDFKLFKYDVNPRTFACLALDMAE